MITHALTLAKEAWEKQLQAEGKLKTDEPLPPVVVGRGDVRTSTTTHAKRERDRIADLEVTGD